MSTPFSLPAPSGGTIHGRIDAPDDSDATGRRPTVVICHGFKGFMDWGFFPALAELLAERGFLAVRFNVSGSGMEPGRDRATDLDGFRRNTFSRELEDLDTVIAALLGEDTASGASGASESSIPASLRRRVDTTALGLIGHSRGGGNALLGATRGRFANQIRALVTWAAVATFDRFGEDAKRLWRGQGFLPIQNARTGQELHLGLGLLEDLETSSERLDLESAAREIAAPWLILHGQEDESVPVDEGERLYRAAREAKASPVQYEAIPGTGHTFGAQHPLAGPTPELIRVFNATQRWLRRHLG